MLAKLFFILALLGIISCSTNQEHTNTMSQSPTFNLKQQLHDIAYQKVQTPTEISGLQMVLIKNAEIVFEHAEGFARIDDKNHKIPLTTGHKVRIASISKFVMTMAFMSLVEEGKVDFDEDISKYTGFKLNNYHFPDQKITARQLLSHTSSIRDADYYFLPLGENFQDFFQSNEHLSNKHYNDGAHFASEPNQGPGNYFTYTNLNFGILAGIIENVSGLRMDQFVKQKLFMPLNLNISFNVCDLSENNFSSVATLFRRGEGGAIWDTDGPWKPQVDGNNLGCYYGAKKLPRSTLPDLSILDNYQPGSNPTLFSPQGGLRASAKDLAILMQLMLNNRKNNNTPRQQQIISKASIDQMMTPVWQYDPVTKNGDTGGESTTDDSTAPYLMSTYGLSTHIVDLKDWGLSKQSRKLYGHLASAYGLQGQFWFEPQTGDGIVILITGVGDDPAKPENETPIEAIEEVLLRLALKALDEL